MVVQGKCRVNWIKHISRDTIFPAMIRLSIGSAILLGLRQGRLDALPTTVYMLLGDRCIGNCSFCTQARDNWDEGRLSRVTWPRYPLHDILSLLKKQCFKRICIQTLTYPNLIDELLYLVERIKGVCSVPLSTSISPLPKKDLWELRASGVERVGIALDAATPDLFDSIKGGGVNNKFSWDTHLQGLKNGVEVFHNKVTTHLILGLGENDKELLETIQLIWDMGVYPALFAFTPLPSIKLRLDAPTPQRYHTIQLAHYLIINDMVSIKDMVFDNSGKLTSIDVSNKVIGEIIKKGEAFRTSGCEDCNRPYYNERPQGPIYNYPRALNENDKRLVEARIRDYGVI